MSDLDGAPPRNSSGIPAPRENHEGKQSWELGRRRARAWSEPQLRPALLTLRFGPREQEWALNFDPGRATYISFGLFFLRFSLSIRVSR